MSYQVLQKGYNSASQHSPHLANACPGILCGPPFRPARTGARRYGLTVFITVGFHAVKCAGCPVNGVVYVCSLPVVFCSSVDGHVHGRDSRLQPVVFSSNVCICLDFLRILHVECV